MSTYYKYAERDVANEINWAVIGKNFTDMLQKESQDREKRKKEIDDGTTKTLQAMANVPVAEHQGLAQRVLDFSSEGTKQLQMLDRMLKSGQIRPDQFIKTRENLLSGTKDGFALVKDMDQIWKTKMERRDKGESSYVEQKIMALAEGFGDFSNMKFSINSADGTVMLATGKKDPATGQVIIDDSPDKLVPIATMRKRLNQNVDFVDLNKDADDLVAKLGEEVRVLKKKGVLTLSDITKRDEYIKAEDDYIKGALSDPLKVASILTDIVKINTKTNNPYDVTFDPNVASSDPNQILLIADPSNPSSGRFTASIDPNSDAYKDAYNALRDRVRVMLDKKEEPTPIFAPQAPQQWMYQMGQQKRSDAQTVNMAAQLYYGDETQLQSALDYFKGLMPNVTDLKKENGVINIVYKDGTTSSIGVEGKTIQDFIRSATEITGIQDINQALKSATIPSGATYNPVEGISSRTVPAAATPVTLSDAWGQKVRSQYPDISTNEDKAYNQLKTLSAYGFKVRIPLTIGDAISIKPPDGEEVEFDLEDPNSKESIYNLITESLDDKKLVELAKKGTIKVPAGSF